MKKYTELNSMEEVGRAADYAKNIEHFSDSLEEWVPTPIDCFWFNAKYRVAEEAELPEQGDEILVWDDDEERASKRLFIAFWGEKAITTSEDGSNLLFAWKHWKPVDKKPEPREWWINEISGKVTSHREDIAQLGYVHVREVQEEE